MTYVLDNLTKIVHFQGNKSDIIALSGLLIRETSIAFATDVDSIEVGFYDPTVSGWSWITTSGNGASVLDDLLDVNTTTTPPQDGDVLVYSAENLVWYPEQVSISGGIIANGSVIDNHLAVWDIDENHLKDGGAIPSGTGTDGWVSGDETWTYASADDPTYTFTVDGDKTGKYSAGMKIKLTQTSVKYFIITKVEYVSSTTVTIYGGTDYDLADATITNPYYSVSKSPHGFPLQPSKWTVELTDTSLRTQSSPSAGTWYNMESLSISLPIGSWWLRYHIVIQANRSNSIDVYFTLSTANNSESNVDLTTFASATTGSAVYADVSIVLKNLTLDSKTTYYLNMKTSQGSTTALYLRGDVIKTVVQAVCVYL